MNITQCLTDIAACLCSTIESSRVPNVCFCGVVPGDAPVADYVGSCTGVDQGMAWVRLMAMYPANGVNVLDESPQNIAGATGADIEIGIIRPVPPPDPMGNPPTPEQYAAMAELAADDATVMLRTIKCCDTLLDLQHLMGQYAPIGPQGDVYGGSWAVAVLLDG